MGVAYKVGQTLRHGADGSLGVSQVGAVTYAASGVLAEVVGDELQIAGVAQGSSVVLRQPL